ncbi:2-hydroxy-3-oxopropionate reductase [Streptomyces sp. CLV115]|uniref:2-hydroxy-3-oxopropionate reductase n=1 Tax=Streptomyces sp. CLV115 TaxID=3138502 RepID=UPI00313B6111
MTDIAFIGLGVMGAPMCRNLVDAGHDVVGFNRSPARVEALVAAGGRGADSIAAAVRDADVVITMLPDSPDVEAVVLGDGGVLESARDGVILIDCSTVRPETSRAVAEAAARRGIRPLDAPVSGGEGAAIDGALSIMVGGEPDVFEAAKPILEAMGTTILHVGEAGSGQTVKAANQLIVAGTIELVSEALVFLRASGVDLESAVRVLAGGLAGNAILDRKSAGMIGRRFEPGFRVDLHHKDLGIALTAARDAGVAVPMGALAGSLMASLRAQGSGSLDHSALLLQVERLSGLTNELDAVRRSD